VAGDTHQSYRSSSREKQVLHTQTPKERRHVMHQPRRTIAYISE
jgi:hypothetical protein